MLNPRVLAVILQQMEEWVEKYRDRQLPPDTLDTVAFWARQLQREIPAEGTLAAEQARGKVEQLEEVGRRSPDETERRIAEILAETRRNRDAARTRLETPRSSDELEEARRRRAQTARDEHLKLWHVEHQRVEARVQHFYDSGLLGWVARRPGGRFLLAFLTLLTGMVFMIAWAVSFYLLSQGIERLTGSTFIGVASHVLLVALLVTAWMRPPLSTWGGHLLGAWIKQLERQP